MIEKDPNQDLVLPQNLLDQEAEIEITRKDPENQDQDLDHKDMKYFLIEAI